MLTSWMITRPLASVAALITPKTFHNLGAIRPPVITLQVRRSDKRGEDPFWNLYGGYRDLTTYVRAMDQVVGLALCTLCCSQSEKQSADAILDTSLPSLAYKLMTAGIVHV